MKKCLPVMKKWFPAGIGRLPVIKKRVIEAKKCLPAAKKWVPAIKK